MKLAMKFGDLFAFEVDILLFLLQICVTFLPNMWYFPFQERVAEFIPPLLSYICISPRLSGPKLKGTYNITISTLRSIKNVGDGIFMVKYPIPGCFYVQNFKAHFFPFRISLRSCASKRELGELRWLSVVHRIPYKPLEVIDSYSCNLRYICVLRKIFRCSCRTCSAAPFCGGENKRVCQSFLFRRNSGLMDLYLLFWEH